jgi:Na+/pantothenate symporter
MIAGLHWTAWLSGLFIFLVIVLAAIMSTVESLFIPASSAVVVDVVHGPSPV